MEKVGFESGVKRVGVMDCDNGDDGEEIRTQIGNVGGELKRFVNAPRGDVSRLFICLSLLSLNSFTNRIKPRFLLNNRLLAGTRNCLDTFHTASRHYASHLINVYIHLYFAK